MENQIFISVIVPVYNGEKFLHQCLDAIIASSYQSFELLVVDDRSTDRSVEIARQKSATILHMAQQSGPGAARNQAAQNARGEILFFVDADVVVRPETIAKVATDFSRHPEVGGVFGSYDDDPAEKNFLSQYKNLYHHFVHQQSSSEALTFWAGCGAIRREVFNAVGGFDAEQYPKPSIEDIELGYRMTRMGYRILLDKELQVKHLKEWRMKSLLRADILCRAMPWSKLLLKNKQLVNDLNLKTSDRISAALVCLSILILPFMIFQPMLLFAILFLLATVFLLNYKLYKFFLRRRGVAFVALAFPLQLLYYLYSSVAFALIWFLHNVRAKREEIKEASPSSIIRS